MRKAQDGSKGRVADDGLLFARLASILALLPRPAKEPSEQKNVIWPRLGIELSQVVGRLAEH